jgi:hypothetical protein
MEQARIIYSLETTRIRGLAEVRNSKLLADDALIVLRDGDLHVVDEFLDRISVKLGRAQEILGERA